MYEQSTNQISLKMQACYSNISTLYILYVAMSDLLHWGDHVISKCSQVAGLVTMSYYYVSKMWGTLWILTRAVNSHLWLSCNWYRRTRKFRGWDSSQMHRIREIICKLNFRRCWPHGWRASTCETMIILRKILEQQESNHEYSENFPTYGRNCITELLTYFSLQNSRWWLM